MLRLVERAQDKRAAQRQLVSGLHLQLESLGTHLVTYRPGSVSLPLFGYGDGRLYYNDRQIKGDGRLLNTFGIYDSSRQTQEIVVEINVSLGEKATAGSYARDDAGNLFLMHSGRVGGGRKGIGLESFWAWLQPEPVLVRDSEDTVQTSILVAPLGSGKLAHRIEHFVRSVSAFKESVRAAGTDAQVANSAIDEWKAYQKEFSGRKLVSVNVDLDYVSYHGDVVEAVRKFVSRTLDGASSVKKTQLIDLLVHRGSELTDVYEIKTSTDRQALYTALGQLLVHSGSSKARRHIVLPHNKPVPDDIRQAIKAHGIALMTYRIDEKDRVHIRA